MWTNHGYTLSKPFIPRIAAGTANCDLTCGLCCPETVPACQANSIPSSCDPSECPSKCCVNETCAANDSACKDSTFIFLMVCTPFIVIICIAALIAIIRVVLRSRRDIRRDIRLPELVNAQRRLQLFQIEQGEPVDMQAYQQGVESPARSLIATPSRLKIVPINTVHLDTENHAVGSSSITPSAFEFKVVEIDDDEFKKKMRENNSSPFTKESLMTINVVSSSLAENNLEEYKPEERPEETQSIQIPDVDYNQ